MTIDHTKISVDRVPGSRGYQRAADLQQQFDTAAQDLVRQDGWVNLDHQRELVADLALEGGGVKGIALAGAVLVLDEAGYRFRCVAGTSAGAIAASLIAALTAKGEPMTKLKAYMDTLEFTRFMPEGRLHSFLDHRGGKVGSLVADASILAHRMGLYPGDYLNEWLGNILVDELHCEHFGDLKLPDDDPDRSLPPGHDYRLLVHTSDITRQQLARLPWDYPIYGFGDRDARAIVPAVRASMSIPFFFAPVTFKANAAEVDLPKPDGTHSVQHYAGGTCTWVDGGMLRNFPIGAFDRISGPPRWPTIGIKLSSLQTEFPLTEACENSVAVGIHCLRTMMNEWDSYAVGAATAGRTVFVDHGGVTATDFDVTQEQQDTLFLNGVAAASDFVVEMAKAGHVPRTAAEGDDFVKRRLAGTP